ncbi:Uncharacterized protein C21orf63 like protein [Cyphomyrmex costatus]|uniref:Uncharacterized protein C21orf63 like protein n=1 Tax=Cyphomyrmex costatus TaxID=456900 RepID=A0A195C8U2_9HYME|nr:Uncharacterized protein C21orf63 like protein [Cyphomyrmex costatus]
MTLKCPPGTTILVEHAQYGRTGMHGISKCNSSVPLMIAGDKPTNHTCIWPQSVQHSLLQMVVGVCQKKRQCKFNTDPKTFQGDPCPGLRKYIEVAYKCRPCKYPHPYTCRYTHTYMHTDACANVREQMRDRAAPSRERKGIVFLRDIRFLFMRTSSIRLVRRSHKNR